MALTVESLVLELGKALAPLEQRLRGGEVGLLFAELGLPAPDEVLNDHAVIAALGAAAEELTGMPTVVSALAAAIEAGDPSQIADTVTRVAVIVKATVAAIDAVAAQIDSIAQSAGPIRAELEAFAAEVPERVFGYLVATYLDRHRPVVGYLFTLIGVVESSAHPATPAAPAHVRHMLRLDRLARLVEDPAGVVAQLYGWGTPEFDWDLLLTRLAIFLGRVSNFAFVQPGTPPVLRIAVIDVGPTDDPVPGVQAMLRMGAKQGLDATLPIGDTVALTATSQGELEAGAAVALLPPADLRLVQPNVRISGSVRLGVQASHTAGVPPIVILGVAGGTRIQAERARVAVGADLVWDPSRGSADGEFVLEASLDGGKVVLNLAGADGFLSTILPPKPIELDVDLLVAWSSSAGLHFKGAAGLEIDVPVDVSVGSVKISGLHLALAVAGQDLELELSCSIAAQLSPFEMVIDRTGADVLLSLPPGGGNLGLADLNIGFRPPTGLGLSVDAAEFTGGGFIRLDPAKGRYSGVLDLRAGQIDITALGLLDTKLPAGHGGYALLLALSATFPAIQIGFGFALTGVGGLLALNRRVDVDALRGRLAAGTAGRILAPQDPIRNAPALLADLDAVFPVAPGVTVVGPTVQLLWAGLVHLDVGVFIELPGPARVVLLGSAHAEIERDGRAYLSIRVDIVGVVDLRAETAAFDAVLVDSHLMGMLDLTGGAAFRLSWGAQPYAVLSLGGFNPAYDPEPLSFPATLTRIAMVHGTPSDELYLRFEGYFAITSNTLQFGASVEVMIQSDHFIVHGSVGFDALVQRSPFHFRFDIRATVTVAYRGQTLAGLTLTGSLTGPGPVVVQAKVCIELLFFDICFSGTFPLGPAIAPLPAAAADLLDTLLGELDNPATLRAAGAPDPYVRLQPPDPSLTTAVVAPSGTLVWEQQSAPLDLLLTRVGGAPLPAAAQVSATSPASSTAQSDWFAPGQFIDLTDDQALTRPAYERLTGGLRLAGAGVADGPGAQAPLTTTQIRLPADATTPGKPVIMFPAWILTSAPGPATPAIAVRTESWIVTTPAGERRDLTGAQARQLATLTTSARAIPATDRLAAFTF